MKKSVCSLMAMPLLFWATACSNNANPQPDSSQSSSEETAEQETNSFSSALNQLAKGIQDVAKAAEDMQNVDIEPINYRDLQDFLPSSAAGIVRTDLKGETSGAAGFSLSTAEAVYADNNGHEIAITITDAGSMTSMITFGMAWIDMNISRESETGFERTADIDGHKSFLKYDTSTDPATGEIMILVANRFVVQVEGRGVSFDELKKAASSVDLSSLERRKNEGVKPRGDS